MERFRKTWKLVQLFQRKQHRRPKSNFLDAMIYIMFGGQKSLYITPKTLYQQ